MPYRPGTDAAVFTEKWGHTIELKLDQTADAAMQQIHDRGYCRKYLHGHRRIMLLAVYFPCFARARARL